MSAKPSYVELLQEITSLKKKLATDQNKFKAAFQYAGDAIALIDLGGRFLEVNHEFCHRLEYSREEFLKMTPMAINSPKYAAGVKRRMTKLQSQDFLVFETEHVGKSGKVIPTEIKTKIIQFDGQKVILAIARDISKRWQTEERLRLYEHIIFSTDDLMSFVDLNYVYQDVNDAYLRAYDKKREEIIGHSVADLVGAEKFEKVIKNKLDLCLAGEIIRYQDWFEYPQSVRKFMDVTYYPFRDKDSIISGVTATVHDITLLKLAKEQREFEHERFTNILQAIPNGVYIVNNEYNIEYFNSVIEREFGPVDGRKCFQYLHDRTEPCLNCRNEDVFAGQSIRREWHSNRNNKYYEIFDSPLKNVDGDFTKVTFFLDVTSGKQVKEALVKSKMLLYGIVNNSSAVIYVKDKHGKYLMVNTRFDALFNDSGRSVIGNTDFDLFPEEQVHTLQRHDQEILITKQVKQFEETVQHKNGKHGKYSG